MTQRLVCPDVEALGKAFLSAQLPAISGYSDVKALVKMPTTLPTRFVRVRRVGGSQDTPVTFTPRLRFTCWGTDDPDASNIATEVESLVLYLLPHTVQGGVPIYRVTEIGGPVPAPDLDTGRPIYFMTVDIRLRGVAQ